MRGIVFLVVFLFSSFGLALSSAQAYQGSSSRLSMAEVREILAQPNPPMNIEDFLTQVRAKSPELFENVILMYRSKSFQASSEEHPRAILYNQDATFVLSFNGLPSHRGFDRVEMMQFDSVGSRFEFRELSSAGGKLKLSAANPALCLACHQSPLRQRPDPRPNWEPYSRWPGAIGSEEGRLSDYFQVEIYRPEDDLHRAEARREQEILKKFVNGEARTNPRYKLLDLESNKDSIFHRPVSFSDLLGRLNFKRIMRLVKSDAPDHFPKVNHLLSGVLRCNSLYVPSPILDQVENWTPGGREDFVADIGQLIRSRSKVPFEQRSHDEIAGASTYTVIPAEYPWPSVSETLYLLFQRFGIDTSDWSMDFRTGGRLAFRERFGIPSNPADAARIAHSEVYPDEMNCHEIKTKALEQAQNLLSLPVLPPPVRKPLLDSCVRCHSPGQTSAPVIHFHDLHQFRNEMVTYKTKSGRSLMEDIEHRMGDHATLDEQMPRGLVRPTRSERLQLISYLKSSTRVVEFRIKAGTGLKAWNEVTDPVRVKVGDILRLVNDDDISHLLHTSGSPCPHGKHPMKPGESYDCFVSTPHDARRGDIYDHDGGPDAPFFVQADP